MAGEYVTSFTRAQECIAGVFAIVPGCHTLGGALKASPSPLFVSTDSDGEVVLAAAMWQNPHVLILDEPTNYLDREGIGALVLAIRDCEGGVLIISHNKEFCDGVATEKWIMNKGILRIKGEPVAKEKEKQSVNKQQEDVYDAFGNKIDLKKAAPNSTAPCPTRTTWESSWGTWRMETDLHERVRQVLRCRGRRT